MKKISSSSTFVMKRVFPIMWFGFLAVFLILSINSGAMKKDPMFLVVPVGLAIFGFFFMKKLVWDLMDEVMDYGDYLLVKNRGEEELVYLSNIMNVSSSINQSPATITLRLRTAGKFGNEVSFVPLTTFSINPFRKNEVAEDLMLRVDKARTNKA